MCIISEICEKNLKKLITEVKVLIQIIPKCFHEYFSLDHRPNKMFIEEKFRKIVCNTFIFIIFWY